MAKDNDASAADNNYTTTMIRRRTNESTTMMIIITSLISYCMLPAVTFAFISPSPQEGIASRRKWILSDQYTSSTTVTSALSTASSTVLFGIKGFRSWFQDQFPNAVRNVDVDEHRCERIWTFISRV